MESRARDYYTCSRRSHDGMELKKRLVKMYKSMKSGKYIYDQSQIRVELCLLRGLEKYTLQCENMGSNFLYSSVFYNYHLRLHSRTFLIFRKTNLAYQLLCRLFKSMKLLVGCATYIIIL